MAYYFAEASFSKKIPMLQFLPSFFQKKVFGGVGSKTSDGFVSIPYPSQNPQ